MFKNQKLGYLKYIKVIKGQNKYLIEDFENLNGCYVFATKDEHLALMYQISNDYFKYEEYQGKKYITFSAGFPINDYYSFKIIKPEQIFSIPFTFNNLSSITPTALNKNFDEIKEYIKLLQESYNNQIVKIDAENTTVMLPNLKDGEVWVRDGNTYRGYQISDLEANIKVLIEEFKKLVTESFEEFEKEKDKAIEEVKGEGDKQEQRLIVLSNNIDDKLELIWRMYSVITGTNRYLSGNDISNRDINKLERDVNGGDITLRTGNPSMVYNGGDIANRAILVPKTIDLGGFTNG